MSQKLYLECYAGISGDMAAAALLDLGADEQVLRKALKSLQLDGYRIEISRVKKSGLDVCDFAVKLDAAHENHDHDMEYLHGSADTLPRISRQTAEQPHSHGYEEEQPLSYGHVAEQSHALRGLTEVPEVSNHPQEPAGHAPIPDPMAEHAHERGPARRIEDAHAHAHLHRGLPEIREIIGGSELTPGAKARAVRIFEILADAEAKAHGVPREEVHFHEVGAVDSIVDIAAVSVCLDNLGIEEAIIPVLYEGRGWIRCQHGVIPVPAPATLNIAQAYGLRLHQTDTEGEFVTPTGAAIAAAIRTADILPDQYTVTRVGLGAGKRQYERPSILRAMLIEECAAPKDPCSGEDGSPETDCGKKKEIPETGCGQKKEISETDCAGWISAPGHTCDAENDAVSAMGKFPADKGPKHNCDAENDTRSGKPQLQRHGLSKYACDAENDTPGEIFKLETNVDDCSGEVLGHAMEELLNAGALEVNYTPAFMKKNRPAYLITVLCRISDRERMEKILFSETTAIGVRRQRMERTVLKRRQRILPTTLGGVEVKELYLPEGVRYAPEYQSVAALARQHRLSYPQTLRIIEAQLAQLDPSHREEEEEE